MDRLALAYTTPPGTPGWKRWLLLSPLARIILFAALMIAVAFPLGFLLHQAGLLGKGVPMQRSGWGQLLIRAVPTLTAYLVLTLAVERRRPAEMALRKLPTQAPAGFAIGVLLLCVVIGMIWLAGSYHVDGTNADVPWLPMILMVGLGAGISEEIVFRGVLLRIVEEGLGSWIALLFSALLFGLIHLGNPNATLWGGTAIAIEAGLLLGTAYMATRSLWLCMGLHAAWNIMEGPVFGTPVSGIASHGWLRSSLSGPDWVSGGSFGPEASAVTVFCCLVLSGIFLTIAIKRGRIVPPAWTRRGRAASSDSVA
jgi:uncharacterized protein